jgi:hypothetical protein
MPVETFESILRHLKTHGMLPQSGMVHLFNWGEPMLHPRIDEIIQTCGKYGLFAFISSNLIYLPKLQSSSLRLLTGVGVSLSGFTDDSYGRIHGKRIQPILNNINRLYVMAVGANCLWRPHVIWHRYRFNEPEMSAARTYFQNRNIGFNPSIACLNGIDLAMDYYFGERLGVEERMRIEQDLFTDYMRDMHQRLKGSNYQCPQWSYLNIDEEGNLLLCCGWSNSVKHSVFGPVLEMKADQIRSLKTDSPLCEKCIQRGIAQFGHSAIKDRLLDDYLLHGKGVSSILPQGNDGKSDSCTLTAGSPDGDMMPSVEQAFR